MYLEVKPYCTSNIDAVNCVLGAGDFSWLSHHAKVKDHCRQILDQEINVFEWILLSSAIPHCQCCAMALSLL